MRLQAAVPSGPEGAGEPQEMGISKKEPLVRIQELLGQGNGSLAQGLTLLASQKGPAMMRHAAASDVAVEIARGAEHGAASLLSLALRVMRVQNQYIWPS